MRLFFRILTVLSVMAVLAVSCSRNARNGRGNAEARAYATAKAASADLGLTTSQTKTLENAFETLYNNTESRSKGIESESRLAEISSISHKEFQKEIENQFSQEIAAEILVWYYNYNN